MFNKEIRFSKHARKKLQERKVAVEMVKRIITSPDVILYDVVTKAMIAIAEVKIADLSTHFIVSFTIEDDNIKVITMYPCKNINRELKRKVGIRWVRVK
jgi:uncharacterized DUF497 family protein